MHSNVTNTSTKQFKENITMEEIIQEDMIVPNPDIEKVDVAAHEDLERFF